MRPSNPLPRLETGVRNFDAILRGGVPTNTVTVVAGPPGAGKTILTQQVCFHNASAERRVLYFNTLSEPTAKTLRYLSQFSFFDQARLDAGDIQFLDLGEILRGPGGLEHAGALIMAQVKKVMPAIVVVDSFKVFKDLSRSEEELRKFSYEVTVNLMAWETTTFLLGEYGPEDISTNPIFSVVDGLLLVSQREESGEQQRYLQVVKMRGTEHNRDEHAFSLSMRGAEVFAPRVAIQREPQAISAPRCKTGISKLDELIADGIPRGSSILLAGVAGTGKTVFMLEFLYRGALQGEKGLYFSFEETEDRLLASGRHLGWELDREIQRGMIEIHFIPQPAIQVEAHLLFIRDRVEAFGAQRVAIDSVSVFLHKVKDPELDREKVFQLATVVHNANAVALFATDIPYGSAQISRFGVEETVVDGVFLLSSTSEGLERQRYIEIYKLRKTAHLGGRHNLTIGEGGISIFPRYNAQVPPAEAVPPTLVLGPRLSTGVPRLDELLHGGLIERSATLVSGSAGVGKTTLASQFLLEGTRRGEPGLYVALEEGPAQILASADALGLPLRGAMDQGLAEILFLSREHVRANQYVTLLADRIRARGIRRVVLDSATHLVGGGDVPDELRQVLFSLVTRFKALGVTCVITLEADSMYSHDTSTDRGLSPVADNLIQLRYLRTLGGVRPTLAIVKSRGSGHDRDSYFYEIATGGLQLGERIDAGESGTQERISPRS